LAAPRFVAALVDVPRFGAALVVAARFVAPRFAARFAEE
jgi:hypothetical protein